MRHIPMQLGQVFKHTGKADQIKPIKGKLLRSISKSSLQNGADTETSRAGRRRVQAIHPPIAGLMEDMQQRATSAADIGNLRVRGKMRSA